jgi:hypothetical protein
MTFTSTDEHGCHWNYLGGGWFPWCDALYTDTMPAFILSEIELGERTAMYLADLELNLADLELNR